MLDIIIGLISGAVGGNVAGAAMKENSLGTIGNSIAGIVGGGAGAGILQALGIGVAGGGGADLQSIISSVVGGGVGGAVVMAVVGLIKKSMGKSRIVRGNSPVAGLGPWRIESSEPGNVIETHEHAGEFKEP